MSLYLHLRCRNFDTFRIPGATVFGAILSAILFSCIAAGHNRDLGSTTADHLIDAASQAKIGGSVAVAYALLHEAVQVEPDNSLARWQLGQVNVGGQWLSIEEAQRRAEADPLQACYRKRRATMGESPQAQLALARWCRGNKLEDEAKFHWESVLSIDPRNKEALRGIGMRWHDGELMTPAQIRDTNKEAIVTKQASRHWSSRVAAWLRALSDKTVRPPTAVLNEIRAINDLEAIPAFEKATLNGSLAPNEKNPAPKRLSLAFLGALNDMRDSAATNSLLRYAVMSPFDEVRAAAIADLRYRPLEDFVPTLLDNLAAPVQSAYRVVNDPDGSVHYLHALYREGPFADWSYRWERSIYQPGSLFGIAANYMGSGSRMGAITTAANTPARGVTRANAVQSARQYEQQIAAGERQVADANQSTVALNDRIIAVLTGTTNQSLGSEPRAWWSWWQDYTDYYHPADRPVYRTQDSSSVYVLPPAQSSGPVECFAQGTPVWTKTGQRSIETLRIGDLVLSQNVNTGEIRFKPVIARTLRPPGPIVQISTGDEKLLATRGHPLWVDGVGWRMAKELGDGVVLNALTGSERIQAVQPAAETETYNLVVEDFNTYFVGKSGVLAHDNTPRRPTQAILPGIIAK